MVGGGQWGDPEVDKRSPFLVLMSSLILFFAAPPFRIFQGPRYDLLSTPTFFSLISVYLLPRRSLPFRSIPNSPRRLSTTYFLPYSAYSGQSAPALPGYALILLPSDNRLSEKLSRRNIPSASPTIANDDFRWLRSYMSSNSRKLIGPDGNFKKTLGKKNRMPANVRPR